MRYWCSTAAYDPSKIEVSIRIRDTAQNRGDR
jgi:hypothetical protein